MQFAAAVKSTASLSPNTQPVQPSGLDLQPEPSCDILLSHLYVTLPTPLDFHTVRSSTVQLIFPSVTAEPLHLHPAPCTQRRHRARRQRLGIPGSGAQLPTSTAVRLTCDYREQSGSCSTSEPSGDTQTTESAKDAERDHVTVEDGARLKAPGGQQHAARCFPPHQHACAITWAHVDYRDDSVNPAFTMSQRT